MSSQSFDSVNSYDWLGTRPLHLVSPGGLSVRVLRDIRDVEESDWDSLLSPDDLLLSHRFVRVCQQAQIENASFWHLVISDGDEIVGIATLHRMIVNLELLSNGLTRKLVAKMKTQLPGFLRLPVLFCGLPVSNGQPCLKIRAHADFNKVCLAVVEVMESVAAATSSRLLCFKEFAAEDAKQMDLILSNGFIRVFSLPSCTVPLYWDSFTSYLGTMRSGYRRQVKSSLDARSKTGLQIHRIMDCASQVETIFGLYNQTITRAKQRLETLNPEFFRLLNESLGNQAGIILIEQAERPLAMAVMLYGGSIATFLFAGMEEERKAEWQLYQNLLAEVVAAAIDSGAKQLDLGQTSYAMKSRMGAEESPRYLYLRYRGRLRHTLLRRFSNVLFPKHEFPRRRVFAR